MLLLAGTQILCGYIYDTVCIYIEGNLDLRNSPSCRRDTVQSELSEGLIVACELSFTLKDVNINGGLVIRSGGEYLALLRRDSGIPLDKPCSYAAHCLDGK